MGFWAFFAASSGPRASSGPFPGVSGPFWAFCGLLGQPFLSLGEPFSEPVYVFLHFWSQGLFSSRASCGPFLGLRASSGAFLGLDLFPAFQASSRYGLLASFQPRGLFWTFSSLGPLLGLLWVSGLLPSLFWAFSRLGFFC